MQPAVTLQPMTSRRRVLTALSHQPVDRTPVCNPTSVATVELMDMVGAPFPQANRDPQLMARLAATSVTHLGFDTVMPVFSVVQESSALGCKMQWEKKDNWPTVKMNQPIWAGPEDIHIPANLLTHPDTKCVLDAIKILRKQFGNDVAIIGKTMGPWSLGYHGLGVENMLLMAFDNPDSIKRCLEKLKPVTIAFGRAQIDAGADALTLPDHATGDLVSAAYYNTFLKDMHAEFAAQIPAPLILHICGKTIDRMDYIAQTGMAAFHFDSKNDPIESMEICKGRIALVGNINNPETLFTKGPEEVRQEVEKNLDAGVQLIGPECAIPLRTPLDNLKMIPKAVHAWHKQQVRGT